MSNSSATNNTVLIGDIGLVILLVSTITITVCMLNQLPDVSYFDSEWIKNGFCVSNADTKWFNSHTLSFYTDSVLAAILFYLYSTQKKSRRSVPPLQSAFLAGAIPSVLGHGFGHLYLSIKPEGMDLRFRPFLSEEEGMIINMPSVASTFVALFTFVSIFQGTMPLASRRRLVLTACIATAGFTVFDIRPKLNFVYGQAAIYISNALHFLSLSVEHKSSSSMLYALYPYMQLPVLAVGVLESTSCTSVLEKMGGHAVFDGSIGLGIIAIELLSRYFDSKTSTTATTSTSPAAHNTKKSI